MVMMMGRSSGSESGIGSGGHREIVKNVETVLDGGEFGAGVVWCCSCILVTASRDHWRACPAQDKCIRLVEHVWSWC